jgi:hypothetical protein
MLREIGTNLWKLEESLIIAFEAMDKAKQHCLHHIARVFMMNQY